jgi:hypothetical protein
MSTSDLRPLAVVVENGLSSAEVYASLQDKGPNRSTYLPGFYRPVKNWDLVVIHQGRLVAALEFKSQVGSFGNNVNNRSEEAVGMGEDLRVAFRTGLLGPPPKPFVGYLMLLEDAPGSRRVVKDRSRHFAVDPVVDRASYARRYRGALPAARSRGALHVGGPPPYVGRGGTGGGVLRAGPRDGGPPTPRHARRSRRRRGLLASRAGAGTASLFG